MDATAMWAGAFLFFLGLAAGVGGWAFLSFNFIIEPMEKRHAEEREAWKAERAGWVTERDRLVEKAVPGLTVRGEILPPRPSRTPTDASEAAYEQKQALRFKEMERRR
jgi:hypothetical protein